MFTIEETGCCFLQEEGTLKPYPRFNPEEDVQKLRKAMKGFGKWNLFYPNAKKVGEILILVRNTVTKAEAHFEAE